MNIKYVVFLVKSIEYKLKRICKFSYSVFMFHTTFQLHWNGSKGLDKNASVLTYTSSQSDDAFIALHVQMIALLHQNNVF